MTTTIGTDLSAAAHWLERGECVGIPTETVYGLAANALDAEAVVKVFEVKNRPAFDPLIVHVADIDAAAHFAEQLPAALYRLAVHFWPGPLTLLLPKRPLIPDLVTSGLSRVALRAPAHPIAQALLRDLAFPLAAPSANPFGYISPTTAQHVFDQLHGKIPYILDGGPCAIGVESTIIGFEDEKPTIYRLGGLALEVIEAVVGPVQVRLNQSSDPAAPGMLKSHYAPRKPLFLVTNGQNLPKEAFSGQGEKIGLLLFRNDCRDLASSVKATRIVALSSSGKLAEAAKNLFAALRELDQSDVHCILAETCPEEGLGLAINDRLRRAAVH